MSSTKFIVLPKSDLVRCRAFLETNYDRPCRSEEFKSSNERCNLLTELDWRVAKTSTEDNDIVTQVDTIASAIAKLDDDKTMEEVYSSIAEMNID